MVELCGRRQQQAAAAAAARTRLGEEGAEAMVVVLGLALLSEVAVGLDAVLEAVELAAALAFMVARGRTRHPLLPPPFRPVGDGEAQAGCRRAWTYLPAGVGNLATGLADYTRAVSVTTLTIIARMSRPARGGQGACACGGLIPLREMTSLMVDV